MNMRNEIGRFARELEQESEDAFNLWTFLPSYHMLRLRFGDYNIEYNPGNAWIMHEATIILGRFYLPHETEETVRKRLTSIYQEICWEYLVAHEEETPERQAEKPFKSEKEAIDWVLSFLREKFSWTPTES